MNRVEKVSVALTSDLADKVRAAVDSGAYASVSEVMRDALRDWSEKRDQRAYTVEEIRRLWDEGIASGISDHYRSAEEIKAEGRRRLAALKKAR